MLVAGSAAMGQTITPPIAEYRGKAQGYFELRNDADFPLAATVEVHGFKVSPNGSMAYAPLASDVEVEFGNSSFTIPARQSHLVFYKVKSKLPNLWFAIVSTMTRAAPIKNQIRINVALPHVVYLYQKQRLKAEDVALEVKRQEDGSYQLQVTNRSNKLSRIERVQCRGFEKDTELGGMPVFPESTRFVKFTAGASSPNASVRVFFQDGFSSEAIPQ